MNVDDGRVFLDGGHIESPRLVLATDRGALLGSGSITGDLVVKGGSVQPELITISGKLELDNTSTVSVEIDGNYAGIAPGRLQIDGFATLGGRLDVSLRGRQSIRLGDTFDILTATDRVASTFGTVRASGLPRGLDFDVTYPANSVRLTIVKDAGMPDLQAGDADQDLDFDVSDILLVQHAGKYLTGQPATWGEGDWNGAPGGLSGYPPSGDGVFNQLDIIAALAARAYNSGKYAATRPSGDEYAVVPEPASSALLGLGVFLVALVLRKRMSRDSPPKFQGFRTPGLGVDTLSAAYGRSVTTRRRCTTLVHQAG
jgi:hypothetical protein